MIGAPNVPSGGRCIPIIKSGVTRWWAYGPRAAGPRAQFGVLISSEISYESRFVKLEKSCGPTVARSGCIPEAAPLDGLPSAARCDAGMDA